MHIIARLLFGSDFNGASLPRGASLAARTRQNMRGCIIDRSAMDTEDTEESRLSDEEARYVVAETFV